MLKKIKAYLVLNKNLYLKTAVAVGIILLLLYDTPTVQSNLHSESSSLTAPHDSIWKKMDYIAMNQRFEHLQTNYPREMIKAIAWCESQWRHLQADGRPFTTVNRKKLEAGRGWKTSVDWGIMQINEELESLHKVSWNLEKIKLDPEYNLAAGLAVLESKRQYVRRLQRQENWPRIEARYNLHGHSEQEMVLKAYNGFQPSWGYLYRVRTAMRDKPWEKVMLKQAEETGARPWLGFQFWDKGSEAPTIGKLFLDGSEPKVKNSTGSWFCIEINGD